MSKLFYGELVKNLSEKAAALIDFAIELSYGDPGETRRLSQMTKPNANSNPENKELKIDPL